MTVKVGSLDVDETAEVVASNACYSDHDEDVRTRGSCDYCGSAKPVRGFVVCCSCGVTIGATSATGAEPFAIESDAIEAAHAHISTHGEEAR